MEFVHEFHGRQEPFSILMLSLQVFQHKICVFVCFVLHVLLSKRVYTDCTIVLSICILNAVKKVIMEANAGKRIAQ